MRIQSKSFWIPSLCATALALAACGGGDGAAVNATSSTLNIGITDAPLTAVTKVWVQFTGVEVKPANGSPITFTFSAPKGFDLLTLQNGNAAELLSDSTVPAGQYEWVRLILDTTAGASYIEDATGRHDIRIPSGAETGLKLVRGFTMPAGGRADFLIDFVLAKSVIAPPGQSPNYLMKPVLRMTDRLQVGTISGTLAAATLSAIPACANKAPIVYLYNGSNVVPDDIYNPLNGAADTAPTVDPLVTAAATLASGQYSYKVAFVPTGSYTVAFTCNDDDPAVDENAPPATPLSFTVFAQPVTVTAGQTTTANF